MNLSDRRIAKGGGCCYALIFISYSCRFLCSFCLTQEQTPFSRCSATVSLAVFSTRDKSWIILLGGCNPALPIIRALVNLLFAKLCISCWTDTSHFDLQFQIDWCSLRTYRKRLHSGRMIFLCFFLLYMNQYGDKSENSTNKNARNYYTIRLLYIIIINCKHKKTVRRNIIHVVYVVYSNIWGNFKNKYVQSNIHWERIR